MKLSLALVTNIVAMNAIVAVIVLTYLLYLINRLYIKFYILALAIFYNLAITFLIRLLLIFCVKDIGKLIA